MEILFQGWILQSGFLLLFLLIMRTTIANLVICGWEVSLSKSLGKQYSIVLQWRNHCRLEPVAVNNNNLRYRRALCKAANNLSFLTAVVSINFLHQQSKVFSGPILVLPNHFSRRQWLRHLSFLFFNFRLVLYFELLL